MEVYFRMMPTSSNGCQGPGTGAKGRATLRKERFLITPTRKKPLLQGLAWPC